MEKTYTIKISISEMEIIPQSHNGVLLFSSFMSPDYPLSFLSLFSCPAMFAIFHWKMILIYSGWNKDTNYCCSPFYKQLFHYNQVFVEYLCVGSYKLHNSLQDNFKNLKQTLFVYHFKHERSEAFKKTFSVRFFTWKLIIHNWLPTS